MGYKRSVSQTLQQCKDLQSKFGCLKVCRDAEVNDLQDIVCTGKASAVFFAVGGILQLLGVINTRPNGGMMDMHLQNRAQMSCCVNS